ncbi:MAG: hypothetical protein U0892_01775 [Pirellulales bacterium]
MCDTPLVPAARLQLLPGDQVPSEVSSESRGYAAQRLTAIYAYGRCWQITSAQQRVFDAHSNRALESWQTWYEAVSRLP